MSPDVRLFHGNLVLQFFRRQRVIALEIDPAYFVLLAAVDLVGDEDLVRVLCELGAHFGIVETFLLEIVDQVALSFIDQVLIDRAFGIDGDQLLLLAACKERNHTEPRAHGADGDHRSHFDFERDLYAIARRIELRGILLDAAGQPALAAQSSFHQIGRGCDALRRVGLPRFQEAAAEARAQGTHRMLQAIRFRLIRAFNAHPGNLGALAHDHDEADAYEFMGVVQVRFGVDLRLKKSTVLKKFAQRVLSDGNARGVVGVFI